MLVAHTRGQGRSEAQLPTPPVDVRSLSAVALPWLGRSGKPVTQTVTTTPVSPDPARRPQTVVTLRAAGTGLVRLPQTKPLCMAFRRARCRSGHLVRGALLDAIGRAERDGTCYREHYGDQLIHNALKASGSGPASCYTQRETGDVPPSAGRGTAAPARGGSRVRLG